MGWSIGGGGLLEEIRLKTKEIIKRTTSDNKVKRNSRSKGSRTSVSAKRKKSCLEPPLGGLTMDQLPSQIVTEVFYWLDTKSLSTICPQVCRQWYEILSENVFWLELCIKMGRVLPPKSLRQKYHKRFDYKKIFVKMPFGRNLILNPSGAEGLENWNTGPTDPDPIPPGCVYLRFDSSPDQPYYYDRWRVENPPDSVDPDFESCFAGPSNFAIAVKRQNVDLLKEGCDEWILNEIRPKIIVSEWNAGRPDSCKGRYIFHSELRDKDDEMITEIRAIQRITDFGDGKKWEQVKHEFTEYPLGVQYVHFASAGENSASNNRVCFQVKTANASVVITFD